MPWWVAALFVAGPVVLCAPVMAFGSGSAWWLLVPAAIGALFAIVFWSSTARRWIRVDGRSLLIGDRKPIELSTIAETRLVEGKELRRLRQVMAQGGGLPIVAAATPAVPVAGGALGSLVLGLQYTRGRRSRRGNLWGMLAQPWMHRAVLVNVPGDKRTPVLLIGTRRPEELLTALRSPG